MNLLWQKFTFLALLLLNELTCNYSLVEGLDIRDFIFHKMMIKHFIFIPFYMKVTYSHS
jgi:hypothetical protein